MVETSPEPVAGFDPQGRVVIWSQGMASLTGTPTEEAMGEYTEDLLAMAGRDQVKQAVVRANNGQSSCFDAVFARSEAEIIRMVEFKIHPLTVGDVRYGGVICARDMTARAETDQTLIESERKHRRWFMASGDANLILDRQGRYVDANPAMETLTGFALAELKSMSVSALSFPDERPTASEWFQELVETGVSRCERVIRRKDGRAVPTEVHAIDLGDGTYHVSIRDVTERQAAEEELHKALQQVRFHIKRMPMGYIIWSPEMVIMDWNPSCERIFGWSRDEIVGKPWDMLVPGAVRPSVRRTIRDLFAGDPTNHAINENLRKDGTIITCEWFNTTLRNPDGEITGAASMVHDVTQRRLKQSQLVHAQKMESLGVLTRGIAHDFGNLLMVVRGNVTMLRHMKSMPKRAISSLELIEDAAERGSALTYHLLAFARTGTHNPQCSDLNKIVADSLQLVRGILTPDHQLETRLEASLPKIMLDRGQTEQVILNLCLNAAQAMPDGGTVTIQTRKKRLTSLELTQCMPVGTPRPGRMVELAVSDTGVGIDPSQINRVFDPFFTTKETGHGLGLSAVLGIVKQHNALILPVSKIGQGTTIHVFYPFAEPCEPDADPADRSGQEDNSTPHPSENPPEARRPDPRRPRRKAQGRTPPRKSKR